MAWLAVAGAWLHLHDHSVPCPISPLYLSLSIPGEKEQTTTPLPGGREEGDLPACCLWWGGGRDPCLLTHLWKLEEEDKVLYMHTLPTYLFAFLPCALTFCTLPSLLLSLSLISPHLPPPPTLLIDDCLLYHAFSCLPLEGGEELTFPTATRNKKMHTCMA